jgi:type III secretory pathway component EscU
MRNMMPIFELYCKVFKIGTLHCTAKNCSFGQSKIKFYGYVFSASGISPDPDKVNAMKNMDRPKSISEIRSLLGLTNYLSKFIDGHKA